LRPRNSSSAGCFTPDGLRNHDGRHLEKPTDLRPVRPNEKRLLNLLQLDLGCCYHREREAGGDGVVVVWGTQREAKKMIYRGWSLLSSTATIWGGAAAAGLAGVFLFGGKVPPSLANILF